MELGVTFLIIAVVIIAIWVIIEIKRMRHKIFAIFLILLILTFYLSVTFAFRGEEIDLKNVSGIMDAGRIYLTWLGGAFGNVKSITTSAINMDWSGNASAR